MVVWCPIGTTVVMVVELPVMTVVDDPEAAPEEVAVAFAAPDTDELTDAVAFAELVIDPVPVFLVLVPAVVVPAVAVMTAVPVTDPGTGPPAPLTPRAMR